MVFTRINFSMVLLFVVVTLVSSFQQPGTFVTTKRFSLNNISLNAGNDPNEYSDFPEAEKPDKDADVDWDAEWKRVVDGQVSPKPTSGIYKSDVELAAIKAKKAAEVKINDVQYTAAKAMGGMSIRSLQGDWRFWIGLLAILSIGTSILSAGQMQGNANESFYI